MNTVTIQVEGVPETLLSIDRIGVIIFLLLNSTHLEGNIAEVGTYKGGLAHYLNKFSNGKQVLLFDTFTGIPMKSDIDKHEIGDFSDSNFDEVKNYFSKSDSIKVVKGLFPESSKGVISDTDKFCFVHLDADQYESTLNSLKFFYDKMISGGVIVFDDYGWLPGVDAALNEFFSDKPEKPIESTFMQCFIIKK